MSKRTVDLGFRRAPLVVQQTLVAWTILGFGAHALLGATGGIVSPVLQQFVAINALELSLRKLLLRLEFLSKCAG